MNALKPDLKSGAQIRPGPDNKQEAKLSLG